MLGEHQDFVDEVGLVLHLQQAGRQTGKQANRQAGRRAGRQAAKNSEVTNLGHDSMYGTGLHLGLSVYTFMGVFPVSSGLDFLTPRPMFRTSADDRADTGRSSWN